MSALGQKQTYAAQQAMSALPLIATAKADIGAFKLISAKGQKRTSSAIEVRHHGVVRLGPMTITNWDEDSIA
jgi:hypothetical protein